MICSSLIFLQEEILEDAHEDVHEGNTGVIV